MKNNNADRADVLRFAEKLRRAAGLLESHARGCSAGPAPAHTAIIKRAQSMIEGTGKPKDSTDKK